MRRKHVCFAFGREFAGVASENCLRFWIDLSRGLGAFLLSYCMVGLKFRVEELHKQLIEKCTGSRHYR